MGESPPNLWGPQRGGSGLIRTVVVALSTFAILLVCFSMYQYQYGQGSNLGVSRSREPRLPPPPTEFRPEGELGPDGKLAGAQVGEAVIGGAEDIHFTIYREEGRQAAAEISFSRYLPKPGSDNEFLLKDPVARIQTQSGNDVRVSAPDGTLEAFRRGAGAWDPRRGKLTGGVIIEIDRRTQAEKEKLPEPLRGQVDPASLVTIRTDELEFDVEYSILLAPGPFRLEASDAMFEGGGLEIRFDEAQGRLESMRVTGGGRIVLLGSTDRFGFALSTPPAGGGMSLVEWLRATVQAKLSAGDAAKQAAAAPKSARKPAFEMQGDVPVFRIGGSEEEKPQATDDPVRYLARFENNINAFQEVGGAAVARLVGDWLEIQRELGEERDAPPEEAPSEATGSGSVAAVTTTEANEPRNERIVLEWSGPLKVETVRPGATQSSARSLVTAGGSPVRLFNEDADVVCTKLTYNPDTRSAQFTGDDKWPMQLEYGAEAKVVGASADLQVAGTNFTFNVAGPGYVSGAAEDASLPAGKAGASKPSPADEKSRIEFGESMVGSGSMSKRMRLDAAGRIAQKEERHLDRVQFTGGAKVTSADSTLTSRDLEIAFGVWRGWVEDTNRPRLLIAVGNVQYAGPEDRLTCDRLEIPLSMAADGRTLPTQIMASGGVEGRQGSATIRGADELTVSLAHIVDTSTTQAADTNVAESDPALAGDIESAAEVKPTWPTDSPRWKAVPRRVTAKGEQLQLTDPADGTELAAREVDCMLTDDGKPARATLVGTADRQAVVKKHGQVELTGERMVAGFENPLWADIPGPGRMVLNSETDLNNQPTDSPVPIEVTWQESMKYRGREMLAQFSGKVEAGSTGAVDERGRFRRVSFTSEQMRIEFVEKPPEPKVAEPDKPAATWGFLTPLMERAFPEPDRPADFGLNQKPASIYLEGDAVVRTEDRDAKSDQLLNRSRLGGPRMSINLRPEVNKALVEGPGTLQFEDFVSASTPNPQAVRSDLFAAIGDSGPSKTLIEWQGRMWSDFALRQVRFEEKVDLKFLTGAALDRVFRRPGTEPTSGAEGRATFIEADLLTVDLAATDSASSKKSGGEGFRTVSGDAISSFRADGNVLLQDESDDNLNWIKASSLIYDRANNRVVLSGTKKDRARIVQQERDRLPKQYYLEHGTYNLATREVEATATGMIGR